MLLLHLAAALSQEILGRAVCQQSVMSPKAAKSATDMVAERIWDDERGWVNKDELDKQVLMGSMGEPVVVQSKLTGKAKKPILDPKGAKGPKGPKAKKAPSAAATAIAPGAGDEKNPLDLDPDDPETDRPEPQPPKGAKGRQRRGVVPRKAGFRRRDPKTKARIKQLSKELKGLLVPLCLRLSQAHHHSAGAVGATLREGSNINKSLTVLGRVIR